MMNDAMWFHHNEPLTSLRLDSSSVNEYAVTTNTCSENLDFRLTGRLLFRPGVLSTRVTESDDIDDSFATRVLGELPTSPIALTRSAKQDFTMATWKPNFRQHFPSLCGVSNALTIITVPSTREETSLCFGASMMILARHIVKVSGNRNNNLDGLMTFLLVVKIAGS